LALGVFLGVEALCCIILILPLPLTVRRSMLKFLSSNPYIAKAHSYVWVIFFILFALFADSLREIHSTGGNLRAVLANHGHEELHSFELAQLCASQRNALFTGISLFLLVLLSRLVGVLTALYKLEQNAEILAKQAKNQESAFVQHTQENEKLQKELADLKASLSDAQAKLNSTKMMGKQAENQQKEYLRLLDENERLRMDVDDLTTKLTAKSQREKKDD
jgi:B-cell receptor-associated protein 31